MAAYCLFDVREITDPDKLARYRSRVTATVKQYGGRYLLLGGKVEGLEGTWRPVIPVLIRFADREAARRWYDSPEYEALRTERFESAKAEAVLVESTPNEVVEE